MFACHITISIGHILFDPEVASFFSDPMWGKMWPKFPKFPSLKKRLIFLFMCSICCCSGNWVFWSRRWWRLKRGKTRWTTTSSGRSRPEDYKFFLTQNLCTDHQELWHGVVLEVPRGGPGASKGSPWHRGPRGEVGHANYGFQFFRSKISWTYFQKKCSKNRYKLCLFTSGGELVWLTLTTLWASLLEWCSSTRLLTRKLSRRQRRWSNWSQKRSGNKILEIFLSFFQAVFVNLCS